MKKHRGDYYYDARIKPLARKLCRESGKDPDAGSMADMPMWVGFCGQATDLLMMQDEGLADFPMSDFAKRALRL